MGFKVLHFLIFPPKSDFYIKRISSIPRTLTILLLSCTNALVCLFNYSIAAAEMEKSVHMANNPDQYPNLVDFATCLMLMKTYNDTQRQIFGVLYDRLTTLGKNEDLTLFCFPMLTQFNISVLCILNQIFEEVSFRSEEQ